MDGEMMDQQLAPHRQRIDEIDTEIIRLLSERGEAARAIGRIKADHGAAAYAPDRERTIYARLSQANPGPFPDEVLHAVYRELMSGTIALERPQRIAFLGPRGSYSHLAAAAKFGAAIEYEPVLDIAAAFSEVERRHADFAVVPIENSTGGGIVDTLDAFIDSTVRVCAEVKLRVHHNVLSRAPLDKIDKIYSKPEVFEQCRNWLMETGQFSKTVPVASSSKAAELAAAEAGAAAIGSTLAAELNDLPILVANIEDNPNNITRFFVIGRAPAKQTGDDKTVLMFAAAHRAGALVETLDAFRRAGVNLTMITSRPSRRHNWDYCFFVDAEGHADAAPFARALAEAREHCLQLVVLGSYPQAAALS